MAQSEISKVASLARLHLTAAEEKKLGTEFEQIKGYFAELGSIKLDATIAVPTTNFNELREDIVVDGDVDLNFSPFVEGRLFKVSKVIE